MDRESTIWTTYTGDEIVIKDLAVRHLVNILNHVQSANELSSRTLYSRDIVTLLKAEANIRIMEGWLKNTGIPMQSADGTWIVVNQTADDKKIDDAVTARHRALMQDALNQEVTTL